MVLKLGYFTSICLLINLSASFLEAQIVQQKISYQNLIAPQVSIKKSSSLPSSPIKSQQLRKLKQLENGKKYEDCSTLAASLFAQANLSSIHGWLLNTWLVCSRQSLSTKALTAKNSQLVKALGALDKHPDLLLNSSAKKALREESWRARTALIEASLKADSSIAHAQVLALWTLGADREQRAKLLGWTGEIASYNHDLVAAEVLLQESLELADSRNTRERLNSVQLALGKKRSEEPSTRSEVLSEAENKYEERFKASLKNNDSIALVEDAVTYCNAFPNGKKAKWAVERILEIYLGFFEKSSDEKFFIIRDKVLSLLEKLEPFRAGEIARTLHRKNDYLGSLRLAERALKGFSQTSQAAIYLYIAGRSAQFLGEYEKAKNYFEKYIEQHAAGDELGEVYFRLALVHLRMHSYPSSITTLERLLLLKNADKYELGARYWLVRALQLSGNPRSEDEAKKLIEKYPFAYYGLRLKAEATQLSLEPLPKYHKLERLEESLSLALFQKESLERGLFLADHGWFFEAYQELAEMSFPNSSKSKILLARLMSEHHVPWVAIKLAGEALEMDQSLRSVELLSLGFPQEYFAEIQTQAAKYKLSPILVRSLIRQESAFNERATSVSKAMGLMQLIPPTAQEVATDLGLAGVELPEDAYLPDINLQLGTSYIAKMIRQFSGNVPMGLAAYNAGPQKTKLFVRARSEVLSQMNQRSSAPEDEIWIDELPWAETSFYVKAILRNTILFQLLDVQEGQKLQLPGAIWQSLAPDLGPSSGLDVRPVSPESGVLSEGEK